MTMRKNYVRCFAEYSGGVWVAYCVDLDLAAQGDTFEEARRKIDAQLRELARDLAGPDRENAALLLARKAPPALWLKYWFAQAAVRVARLLGKPAPRQRRGFNEPLPAC